MFCCCDILPFPLLPPPLPFYTFSVNFRREYSCVMLRYSCFSLVMSFVVHLSCLWQCLERRLFRWPISPTTKCVHDLCLSPSARFTVRQVSNVRKYNV